MTCKEVYVVGMNRLDEAGVDDAGFDALQLFASATGMTREHLIADGHLLLDDQKANTYLAYIERRKQGEPLQYILGEWEFYSLPFQVGPGVLIPRADTEILVDECLRLLENAKNPKVADLCTGSGCIAVAIAKSRPDAEVLALELSPDAATYTKQNILLNGTHNVTLQMADVLNGPGELTDLDLIVSNPPYIPVADLSGLSKEVHWEPSMALDGGKDGLDFYRSIIARWQSALKPTGMMAFEVGIHQAGSVAELLEPDFTQVYIVPDLNDIPRVVLAIK